MLDLNFSPEQPFGFKLYPYFENAYEIVTGHQAKDFEFIGGVTPLSANKEVILWTVTYIVTIFGGQFIMKNFEPIRLNRLFQIHNLLLTFISLGLLLLFVEQIFPMLYRHGLFYTVCHTDAWTQPLELLYFLNYLVKYHELLDTVFLVLKKKKLDFLHYYHHSLTMVLCYTQLLGKTAVSYVPVTLNLTVHVFMYYYYFQSSRGKRVWWKKYLTMMQITQFIIDLFFVYFCTYTYYVSTYHPWLPNYGTCRGTETAAFFGCALLSSYLFLFIDFFKKTYNAATQKQKNKKIE